jgi:hypothetical protein
MCSAFINCAISDISPYSKVAHNKNEMNDYSLINAFLMNSQQFLWKKF